MNSKIEEFAEIANRSVRRNVDDVTYDDVIRDEYFAELIIREISRVLLNEAERLRKYSNECDSSLESDEANLLAEKCIDLNALIKDHFGVRK